MNYNDLLAEVQARGFDYLDPTRINRYINQVYLNICEEEQWPFLETTETGTAPLTTTAEIRGVDSVVDTTNASILSWMDRRRLIEIDRDLTTTGTPRYWYQTTQSTISVYPANTAVTLSVHFFKVPTELSAESDTPLIPQRWQDLIIDGVAIRAYKDTDDYDAAGNVQQWYDAQLQQMRDSELRHYGEPDFVTMTATYESGGLY